MTRGRPSGPYDRKFVISAGASGPMGNCLHGAGSRDCCAADERCAFAATLAPAADECCAFAARSRRKIRLR